MSSLDYNPIFENDFYSDPAEMTPEDFDNINEFLNDVNPLDIIEESTISRFSNRRGEF